MLLTLQKFIRATRLNLSRALRRPRDSSPAGGAGLDNTASPFGAQRTLAALGYLRRVIIGACVVGALGLALYKFPPMFTIAQGEVGLRTNQLTGTVTEWREGSAWALPGWYALRVVSLRDQSYRPEQVQLATGPAPLQSVEGLSFGVDLVVRYALDPTRLASGARNLPADLTGEVVEPAVQGVIYKVFARYTIREAFSTKRAEIAQAIEAELKPRLAADGLLLRTVQIGKIDLPADYKRGMEHLLAEELETQKMRYTLDLKDKRVKETELDALAEKVRREVQAEAAAREQVIAAKGQEEAMKHVLPFKQRQIEQRQLEAEADKQSRIRTAEGSAQARRIEANGEADARTRLAEAEVSRLDKIGKVNAEQMAREGVLVTRHPLLIQKAMADKLSDKVQVIIAPPSANGGFIGEALLGATRQTAAAKQATAAPTTEVNEAQEQ
jgi:regulator of protease activity HflC (stomatin/prohibitin superfamily)